MLNNVKHVFLRCNEGVRGFPIDCQEDLKALAAPKPQMVLLAKAEIITGF